MPLGYMYCSCPSKQGELSENIVQNLFDKLPPHSVLTQQNIWWTRPWFSSRRRCSRGGTTMRRRRGPPPRRRCGSWRPRSIESFSASASLHHFTEMSYALFEIRSKAVWRFLLLFMFCKYKQHTIIQGYQIDKTVFLVRCKVLCKTYDRIYL